MVEKERITLRHIKNQLSSYEYWVSELFQVDDQLMAVRRMIEEPRVTQYSDKPMIQGSPDSQHNQFQSNLMHEEKLIKQRDNIEKHLFTCISILSKCDIRTQDMIYDKFIKDIRDESISKRHNYSRTGIYYVIEKELKKVVKTEHCQ